MYFIIKKQGLSDKLKDFLLDKCLTDNAEQIIFKGNCWNDVTSVIQHEIRDFFEYEFRCIPNAVEYIAKKFNDPIKAVIKYVNNTGDDYLEGITSEMIAQHHFNLEIAAELYHLRPTEKEFIYKREAL